jgi:cell division septum initiation protein DivIVA
MSDRAEVSYWLRGIVPYLQRLPDYLDEIDESEHRLEAIRQAVAEQKGELDRINGEIVKLNEDKVNKYHEVASIIPETHGQARVILEAAEAKAVEIKREADAYCAKRKEEGDDYFRRNVARIEKFRAELS